MDALRSLSSSFGMNTGAIQDTLKLVVIGGTVEAARRTSVSAWNGFVDSFFLTAHFSQEDYPYDWLMHWLSKQPAWGRSREFEITTRSSARGLATTSTADDLDGLEDEGDDGEQLVHGRKKRRVAFMPSVDTTHTIYYRGHWLRITRTKRYPDYGHGSALKISVVARNNTILKRLVLEAKREYEKDAEHRVHIFLGDTTYACWRWNGARQKRPMSSIVLQPGVKDMLLNDCKDFLGSEEWYASRGIPFRRGYLLHGVPGSGKTSLIHSLAGELGLDIYVVSLSGKGMSDERLAALMGGVPTRCILLLEDLDAAFTRSVSRDGASTGAPTSTAKEEKDAEKDETGCANTLSLSGLLNSLDGVAAAEGRLLFATTNHIERLDPALSRPGRMDVWVNFGWATKWQAEGVFKCFFPYDSATAPAPDAPEAEKEKDVDSAAADAKDGKANVAGSLSAKKSKAKANGGRTVPLLSEDEITKLAKEFADAIPEDELSVASLQGYLLKNKTRPRECVKEVGAWIITEREVREKLKKEKEAKKEKEEKSKKEKEEKAKEEKEKKEKEEKEAKEKEEKEAKELKEKEEAAAKELADKEKERERKEKRKTKKSRPAPPVATATTTPVVLPTPATTPEPVVVVPEASSDVTSSEESSTDADDVPISSGTEITTDSGMTTESEGSGSGVDGDASSSESDKEGPMTKEKWVSVKPQPQPAAAAVVTPVATPVVAEAVPAAAAAEEVVVAAA